ncbi:GNAT family N-acetyltransferase [Snodgrassella sp.]|uniref:GNAT family N-acetyltransferase n=1 Tax=Snodgrassella sp. TaxID=2815304 RepID=UPI00338D38E1
MPAIASSTVWLIIKQKESRKFIQERLEKQDSDIFIAYHQQQTCGFVQLYFSFSSLSISPTIILNDLYVSISHRQKGIATQLMQYGKNLPIMHRQ